MEADPYRDFAGISAPTGSPGRPPHVDDPNSAIDPNLRRSLRIRGLTYAFFLLAFLLLARYILGHVPRAPGITLVNLGVPANFPLTIRSDCGDVIVPPLAEGESARIDLVPMAGCEYIIDSHTVSGDRLLELMDLARRERTDVEIRVGYDDLWTDLSDPNPLW